MQKGEHFYVIQRRATPHEDAWLKMQGQYDTAEEAFSELDRRYGKDDFEMSNHRVMEAYYVLRYRKVKR